MCEYATDKYQQLNDQYRNDQHESMQHHETFLPEDRVSINMLKSIQEIPGLVIRNEFLQFDQAKQQWTMIQNELKQFKSEYEERKQNEAATTSGFLDRVFGKYTATEKYDAVLELEKWINQIVTQHNQIVKQCAGVVQGCPI